VASFAAGPRDRRIVTPQKKHPSTQPYISKTESALPTFDTFPGVRKITFSQPITPKLNATPPVDGTAFALRHKSPRSEIVE